MTRANAVTFTGGTNVLELQASSTITGNVVAFSAADTLRLGGATNASFDVSQIGASAQYQGFGLFAKTGSSTWTLTGGNSTARPWSIDAGTLAVNGTLANAAMTVNSGGTLSGTGTVGAVTVKSGGTFAPGSGAPGSTMTVGGNLAFQSGALYLVQVNPSTASSAVAGSATLTGGTVNAQFASGSYLAKQYTILTTTGGLGGTTFASLTNTNLPAGFTDSLSYSGNTVFLNLTAALGATGTGGLNGSQQTIATALNTFFNNGGMLPPNFVTIFGLTGGNLTTALSQLSGEAATGAEKGAFQLTTTFLNLMLDPWAGGGMGGAGTSVAPGFARDDQASLPSDVVLAYASILKAPPKQSFDQRWSVWGAGFGGSNRTNGDAAVGANTVTAGDYGFATGADYHLAPNSTLGFTLAGAGTNWNLAEGLGGGRSDAFQAGVYGKTRLGRAYLAAALAFTNHWFSTSRTSALGEQLAAKFEGQSYGGRLEAGYRYAVLPLVGITPYAAVQAQAFHTPGYSETNLSGTGFGLAYNARNATDTRSELGARFDDLAMFGAMPLVLRGRLAWAHDWISNPSLGAAFQALPGVAFTVNGAAPPKDSALATLAAELHLNANWMLAAKFDGEFAARAQTYAGTGTLRYSW